MSGVRPSPAPRETAGFPLPLPAGNCLSLPSALPVSSASCCSPEFPPHLHLGPSVTASLLSQTLGCVCPEPAVGSEKCHLATQSHLHFILCKMGSPELTRWSTPCEPWQTRVGWTERRRRPEQCQSPSVTLEAHTS